MATPEELLRQAAGIDGYAVAGGLGTDAGLSSATNAELDLRTLTPNALRAKYGDAAASGMMGTLQRGISDRVGDANVRNSRTGGQFIFDTSTGVASGAVGSLGSLLSLGTGLVNAEAGTTVAKKVQEGMQWMEGNQSDAVNAARRLQRSDSQVDARDNTELMKQDIASGTPELAAELRRWGRDVIDTVGNSTDPTMFAQGTAEATGSLLAGGPIAKGLRGIGAATMAVAGRAGALSPGAATAFRTAAAAGDDVAAARAVGNARGVIGAEGTNRLANIGSGAAWPLATAGLEAGGAYSGSVSEVMEMSFEDLAKNSPDFPQLIKPTSEGGGGLTPEKARTRIANDTGLRAAVIQAPIGFATGYLTRFAETPTRAPSVGSAVGNVLVREPTEEAFQSTSGGVAQNYAIQQNADTTRTLSEGVGEQTAQGALYGMSSAGVLQGPGMAARGTYQGSKAAIGAAMAAGSTISGAARNRARDVMAAEEQKSNIGTAAMQAATTQVNADLSQSMPEIVQTITEMEASPQARSEALDFVDKINSAMTFDLATEAEAMALPDDMAQVLAGSKNRTEAVLAAAAEVAVTADPSMKLIWAEVLQELMKPAEGIAESDIQLMDSLPEKQMQQLRQYQQLSTDLRNTPVIRDAIAQQVELAKLQTPVSEAEVATPAGRAQVSATVAAATQNPAVGNLENIKTILDHASNGRIELSTAARRSLNISASLLEAVDRAQEKAAQYGLTPRDAVSENVLTGNDPAYGDYKSASQHIREIRSAVNGGNITLGRGLLDNFGSFVDHMSRKVEALNKHFDTFGQEKRPAYVPYKAYNPVTGDLFPSDVNKKAKYKGEFVEPTNEKSVLYAQNLAAEAEVLNGIFNGLVQALPELNVRALNMVPLNPQLVGKPADVAARFQAIKNPPAAVKAVPAQKTEEEMLGDRGYLRPDLTEAEYNAGVLEALRLEDGVTIPDDAPEPAPVPPVVSRISAEQAAKLSDAGLNDRLNALIDKSAQNTLTEQDTATFEVLDAEMTSREDAAATEARLEERRERNRVRNAEVAAVKAKPEPVKQEQTAVTQVTNNTDLFDGTVASPWLMSDGSFVDTRGDHVEIFSDSDQSYADFMRRTGGIRAATFTDVDAGPVLMLHLVPEQKLTSKQLSKIEELVTENPGMQVRMGRSEKGNPEYSEPMSLSELRAEAVNAPSISNLSETGKRFPNLIARGRNFFVELFNTPKVANTRVRGENNPIAVLQGALEDGINSITNYGVTLRNKINEATLAEYRDLLKYDAGMVSAADRFVKSGKTPTKQQFEMLANVKGIAQVMQANLTHAKYGKRGSLAENFLGSDFIHRLPNFKNLNIVEQNEDGSLQYNNELIELASLAGFQWALTIGVSPPMRDSEKIQSMTGIAEEMQGNLARDMSQGFTTNEIADALVPMVKRYWDVRNPRNDATVYADQSYLDGIPTAVAMEVVNAMLDLGLITETRVQYTDMESGTPRDLPLFQPMIAEWAEPLRHYPTLIEELVMKKPEFSVYFGDERAPVAQTKMNTEGVENTDADKAAIKAANDTPYFLNKQNFDLFTQMDADTIERVFGSGYTSAELNPETTELNAAHAKSAMGQNAGIKAGWTAVLDLQRQMPTPDAPIHYAHNMSTVNRLQQLGTQTPQGNKLVREMVLPTQATVDLVNDDRKKVLFDLAVAQALEIKIHRKTPAASIADVQKLITGPLAPAVTAMQNWLADPSTPVDHQTIVDALKSAKLEVTPLAFHALKEVARLNMASPAERAKFQTALYIEADGVTNGVVMAMLLMGTGRFTPDQILKLAKGGISFGSSKTMADLFRGDDVDLYADAAAGAQVAMLDQIKAIRKQTRNRDEIMATQNATLNLMAALLPGIKVTDVDGALVVEFDRSVSKNPMTVTLYGSSPSGIANKLTSILLDALYEAASRGEVTPAMQNNMNHLMANAMGFSEKNNSFYNLDSDVKKVDFSDMKKLALNSKQRKQLQQNILGAVVSPLRQGIEKTLGEGMMRSTTLLRKSMQVQSIFFEQLYRQAYRDAVQARKDNDPTFRSGDGLSATDVAKIRADLATIAPWFKTANQNMLINKFRYLDSGVSYGRSMNERLRPMAKIMSPVNSGVAAIPYINIGVGDGQTIQRAWGSGNPVVTKTLPVFDGVNASLNDIDALSELMNESVRDAGMSNPHAAALDTFTGFLSDPRVKQMLDTLMETDDKANTAVLEQLDFALGLPQGSYTEMTAEMYTMMLDTVMTDLGNTTRSVENRHRAMKAVQMSYDQFAAVGRPFQTEGTSVDGMSNEQIAKVLNDEYLNQTAELAAHNEPRQLDAAVASAAVADPTFGVQIVTPAAIAQLTKGQALLKPQQDLLSAVLPVVQDYSIIAGTPAQLNDYISSLGQDPIEFMRADGAVRNGIIDPQLKQILLATDSVETMLHELVHAATFNTVQRHYNGEQLSKSAVDAIGRLETLMDQFMGMRIVSSMTAAQISALENAKLEISNALTNPNRPDSVNQAVALNEFMAWTTTNAELAERLSKIKANPISRLVKAALDGIKSLLGLPKADMLSNVVFNTAIVAQEQQSLSTMVAGITMDHAVRGADSMLIRLREKLNRDMLVYLDEYFDNQFTGQMLNAAVSASDPMKLAKSVSTDFANVFNLSPVETSTLEMIVGTMATGMNLDSTALGQAQVLYQHALSELTVDSFVDPTNNDPQSARYYAEQKFNLVTGKTGRQMDKYARSSLLASFLGMAVVSPEFKAILAKMSVPVAVDNRDGTFDAAALYRAEQLLSNIGRLVSGQGKSKMVDGALSSLAQSIFESVAKEKGMVDAAQSKIDAANDYVVNAIGRLSEVGTRFAERTEASNSKVVRATGRTVGVVSNLLTTEGAAAQAEIITEWGNKLAVPATVSRLISDLIGRTDSNANLYDRIKLLRSTIQQLRQHFRNDVPLELSSKFTTKPTDAQWTAMFNGLAKTDLAALRGLGAKADIAKYVTDAKFRQTNIASLENIIRSRDPANFQTLQAKSKQLANYMVNGVAGANLLSNAEAIANLLNISRRKGWVTPTADAIQDIDHLVTMYALDLQPKAVTDQLSHLFKHDADAVMTVIDYMNSNRADELKKVANSAARFNAVKGYIPSNNEVGKSLRVVSNADAAEMRQLGYTNVGTYNGSQLDTGSKAGRSYFFSNLSGKAAVAQGIMQNIHRTAGGVDPVTGFSTGMTAGRITSLAAVQQITARINSDRGGAESLKPVFDQKGKVIAYERSVNPAVLKQLNQNTQLHEMLGVWRGRQVEESMAREANVQTLRVINKMYTDAVTGDPSQKKGFVNLMNPASLDPVIRDMVDLFSFDTKEFIKNDLNGQLWVRRDMLEDVTGYRNASVGDFWSGVSRWSPKVQQTVRDLTISVFGINAFKRLLQLEQIVQGLASDARTLIVVKSGLIPVLNFMSNIYHLLSVGVPIGDIVKNVPRKLVELRAYNRGVTRRIQIEVEIRANRENKAQLARLRAEMRSINDSFKRLSIAPLIEAGEFSTVADVGDQADNLELSSGRVGQWLDNQVAKLPAFARTPAKYLMVSKDTALFQGLQKSVQYGDFIAKAVMFDHHTRNKKMAPKESLGIITDEFVNYDRLPGRMRGGLENFGLLWFYNFKLRMVKVAASTLRNRPVYALLTSMLPAYPGAEMPIGDSIISKVANDSLGYSIGPEMGFRAPTLNPWWNLTQ